MSLLCVQASVGIALLSGFGNTNTKEDEDLGAKYPDDPELASANYLLLLFHVANSFEV